MFRQLFEKCNKSRAFVSVIFLHLNILHRSSVMGNTVCMQGHLACLALFNEIYLTI